MTPLRPAVLTVLTLLAGCAHASEESLLGTWTNHHVAERRPAVVSIDFQSQNTATLNVIDSYVLSGWQPQTPTTVRYSVIAPGKLRIDETMGSTVVNFRIDGKRLILSGPGLLPLLGNEQAPQTLDADG